ncbi:Uncharacterized membrane protein YkvA, DUF1232 family [Arthrobacter subterraneus]|uniref:Uncharacterized membrane protein YkvA, DUF1232 family n=1 Tax=Arthrobacter subterraneus TaxID=335973 RepID=A0A1G8PA74_9MICC|nr:MULTISPECIES: DUF1232 domain-containing protein [Arthrobacter]SDI89236.1 Uncharacterized membrane protein YkvA, DUF1232 family [Arthrobacter subterraneus]
MLEWWQTILTSLGGIAALYAVLLVLLWVYARNHPQTLGMKDALRLVPDLLRMIKSLAADKSVSPVVRVELVLLLVYLLLPIDVVPDFFPVIGYADDVIVVAVVLRSVLRRTGPDALAKHWPGSTEGLQLVMKLAGTGTGTGTR